MKKEKINQVPPIKVLNKVMTGGFSALSLNQMAKINGGQSNSRCQNSSCTSGTNSSCTNQSICGGSQNTSCTNDLSCIRIGPGPVLQ